VRPPRLTDCITCTTTSYASVRLGMLRYVRFCHQADKMPRSCEKTRSVVNCPLCNNNTYNTACPCHSPDARVSNIKIEHSQRISKNSHPYSQQQHKQILSTLRDTLLHSSGQMRQQVPGTTRQLSWSMQELVRRATIIAGDPGESTYMFQ